MAASDNGSDYFDDKKCTICKSKGIIKESTTFCLECSDHYCLQCSGMHRFFPALQGHTLLDQYKCNDHSLLENSTSDSTERCPSHKAQQLELYCEDHDEVVCLLCVAIKICV
jgi:hypothetical protein